ncbi:MAG: hypothetical protein MMC33_003178 [Icmadophila ericetorum]|nr:hypothetical protein [Icmadophila ericetorum]
MAPNIEPTSVSYRKYFELNDIANRSEDKSSVGGQWEEFEESKALDWFHSSTRNDSTLERTIMSERGSMTNSDGAKQPTSRMRPGSSPIASTFSEYYPTFRTPYRRYDDKIIILTNHTANGTILYPNSTISFPRATGTATVTSPTSTNLPFMKKWWKDNPASMVFVSVVVGTIALAICLLSIGSSLAGCVKIARIIARGRRKKAKRKGRKRQDAQSTATSHANRRDSEEGRRADLELGNIHEPERAHAPPNLGEGPDIDI